MVILNIPLTDQEAWDLAQLVKRFGYTDALSNAANYREAHRILDIITIIRQSLENEGISPR